MITWIYFITAIIITILVHEFGHMIGAILCGVKVEKFSIGFGKPIWHKIIKGIDFALTPFIFGGYTKLAGEYEKKPHGFLAQRYSKKLVIILAGVLFNLLIAFIAYWINYKSIKVGLILDFKVLIALFQKDYSIIANLLQVYQPNEFLLQLELLSFGSFLFNLIPFPALDGGLIWLVLLERKVKDIGLFLKKVSTVGFFILTLLELVFIYYIFLI